MNKRGEFSAKMGLVFVLAVNIMFFLAQTAILHINPSTGTRFYNYEGSMMSDFDDGNYTLDENVKLKLPASSSTVTVESGNFFTDTFSALKQWLLDTTGLTYLLNIVNAVPNFLKAVGLPVEVAFALGWFWHVMTILLIIMMIAGL